MKSTVFSFLALLCAVAAVAQSNTFPSAGNVGIGTTTPSHPLSFGTSLGSKIALYDAGGGSGYGFGIQNNLLQIYANTSVDRVGIGFGNSGSFSETLTVKGSKVGIGTNGPARILHVVDPANDTQLRLGGGTRDIAIESLTGAGVGQIVNVANVSGQSRFQFGDATITVRSGKVGVGVASPVGLVDIWNHYSSGVDSLRFSCNDGFAYWMGIQPYVVGDGNVGYKFRTNNIATTTDALAITGDGKVGIGTISPAAALHVGGDFRFGANAFYTDLLFKTASALPGYNQTTDLTPTTIPGDGVASAALRLKSALLGAGTTRMDLIVDGNVGIGTTSPTHKLAVNGTIRAKEVIVDTGWADHVFAADYRLAPLSEVEQHIQQNGHLPDVPSAAEVAARGVSVGEMQKILLQKVEELTLHQIEQEKRLDRQAERIRTLEAENALLRAQ